MRTRRLLFCAVLFCTAAVWSATAQAAVNCSVTPTGFTAVYYPTVATPTDAVSSVTINCTRATGDPVSISYSLASDNGLNPKGQGNQASFAGGLLPYDIYQDAARTVRWGPKGGALMTGSIPIGNATSISWSLPYYVRIPAGTNVASGMYSDTVITTLTYNGNQTTLASSFPVQIIVTPSCQLSTPPGNMSFAYTSFQTAAATASTPFAVLCTAQTPYTLSLATTSGTLLGLAYTLSLSSSGATGSGAAQNFTVNGSIAGNQAGTCAAGSCSASNVHTLMVSY